MKFNFKSKRVIGGLFSVVLLALGVANPEIISGALTTVTCSVAVKCDA